MRFTALALADRGVAAERDARVARALDEVRRRPLRALPDRPDAVCLDGPVYSWADDGAVALGAGALSRWPIRPTLAVWKFTSCDGCQLSLLDLEDELLAIADAGRDCPFPRGLERDVTGRTTSRSSRGRSPRRGQQRIREIRDASHFLISIGACATAGGIQALRNFADIEGFLAAVYATPEYVSTLATSTPISDHVRVDLELQGCPINKRQLLEVITAFLHGRRPNIPPYSVCVECKRRGTPCVMVARGVACLGPVTNAGCGAICPAYAEAATAASARRSSRTSRPSAAGGSAGSESSRPAVDRALATFNVEKFRREA